MNIKETKLKDCFVIEPEVFRDDRGYFYESFNLDKFNNALGLNINFVQDNDSFSIKGTLRGLHFQIGEHAQAKLVRVLQGKVLDVVVDLRRNSPSFGEYLSLELSEENKKQLFIPRGFAHGFIVLSKNAIFSYKCDNYYHKDSERGIIFNDKTLNIDWNYPENKIILSEKDRQLPTFQNLFK